MTYDANKIKTIFWNVDTQYDFMREDGKLPVPGASEIEPNLERLTKYAANNNLRVVNTADYHTLNSEELSDEPDFMTTFPPHCIKGTKGVDFIPATAPDGYSILIPWQCDELEDAELPEHFRNIVIYKDKFDVFEGNPHTDSVLETLQPDRAIVYGVATNVCVHFAVTGLLDRGIEVYVPMDAIKELPGLPLEETLKEWEDKGAKLTTVDSIVDMLDKEGR